MAKIDYMQRVDTMLSNSHKEAMILLLDMGFTDFKKNESLVRKYDGNIIEIMNNLEWIKF